MTGQQFPQAPSPMSIKDIENVEREMRKNMPRQFTVREVNGGYILRDDARSYNRNSEFIYTSEDALIEGIRATLKRDAE